MDVQSNDVTTHLDVPGARENSSWCVWCARLMLWLGIFLSAVLFWWLVGLMVFRLLR